MSTLTAVYLKATGHVLAALTRVARPEGDEPVTALVGPNLTVSGIPTAAADVTFPVNYLAAVTVNDQPGVVISPYDFQVIEDPQDAAHPKIGGIGAPGTHLTIDSTSGAKITVTTVSPVTFLPAVVVLQSPSQVVSILSPFVVSGSPSGTVVADKAKLTTGTWDMFAFVQGQPPVSASQKMP